MATFLQIADLAENAEFKRRVRVAMWKVASQVVGETIPENFPNRGLKRHILGTEIIVTPDAKLQSFSTGCALNPAINSAGNNGLDCPDDAIEYTITMIYDDVAGVLNAEITPVV